MQIHRFNFGFLILCLIPGIQNGCKTPSEYRETADKAAYRIIEQKQQQMFGRVDDLSIERPGDILRRRLLEEQNLPISHEASLGSDRLKKIEHWPEDNYPVCEHSDSDSNIIFIPGEPVVLSLMQSLQVGARNNFDYQSRKERVFQAALVLDLEQNVFRNTFAGKVETLFSADSRGGGTVSGLENSGSLEVGRKLKSGAELSSGIAIDMVNLLTQGGASSLGMLADASIFVPLLRGSKKHIVTEPLTQAERDVIYAIFEFERFKQVFAVDIAREYLDIIRQMDQVNNEKENYESLISSAQRSRRLADAGRLPEIQVDQAVQDELRARNRWIAATQSYKQRLDNFKRLLGQPPDANIILNYEDMKRLTGTLSEIIKDPSEDKDWQNTKFPAADDPVELVEPGYENAGPLEIGEPLAVRLGMDNRYDLRVVQGRVYDAQRAIVVLADDLEAELTFVGAASLGDRRGVSTATLDNARLRSNEGRYSALLDMDLPLERTSEQNAYRAGFIVLESAVRDMQDLEDQIKLSVRNKLRDMLLARESLRIQAKSVKVAQKRVRSTNLFLEAGRAEIRDLLEAQESLLSAQNSLTSAMINYRVAELELQSDMGVLKVDKNGLWQEFSPEEMNHVKK